MRPGCCPWVMMMMVVVVVVVGVVPLPTRRC
jgi:hypothetical protein